MRAIVELLLLLLIPLTVGFAIGRLTAPKERLDKSDRKELVGLRGLRDELTVKAAEAATLGDDFGVTALALIAQERANRELKR